MDVYAFAATPFIEGVQLLGTYMKGKGGFYTADFLELEKNYFWTNFCL